MYLGLKGKRAIVCASSKGLGRACAMSLAREGCEVVINGRDAASLAATAAAIESETGARVIQVVADVGTEAGRAALLGMMGVGLNVVLIGVYFTLKWRADQVRA